MLPYCPLQSDFDNPRLMREFSQDAWTQGHERFKAGGVGHIDWEPEAEAWRAPVDGDEGQTCTVSLRVWNDGGPRLSGRCSCTALPPCEHAAALLYAIRERRPVPRVVSAQRSPADPGEDLDALRLWARTVEEDEAADEPEATPSNRRLVYVLCRRGMPSRVEVETYSVSVRKDGSLGPSAPYDMRGVLGGRGNVARYVTDEDRLLWFRLTRLRLDGRYSAEQAASLGRHEADTQLLRELVATGRCFLDRVVGPPLRLADPRRGGLEWSTDDTGRQRLVVRMEADSDAPVELARVLLPLRPPHYLVPEDGRVGPLELDLPEHVASSLADVPILEPETVAVLPPELVERLDSLGLPQPTRRSVRRQPAAPPGPRLLLGVDPRVDPGKSGTAHARATVSFDYGALRVQLGPDGPGEPDATLVSGQSVLKAPRDLERESAHLEQLTTFGLVRHEDPPRLGPKEGVGWAWVVEHAVPSLRREGWTIEIDEGFPVQPLSGGEWYLDLARAETSEASDHWFSLELGVDVDGVRVDLLSAVVAAIRSGRLERDRIYVDTEEVPLQLEDGRWVLLPGDRLARILDVLVELFDDRLVDGRLPLGPTDGGRLLALEGFAWRGDQSLRTLAEQLTGQRPIAPIAVPEDLATELRSYQIAGLQWLGLLREHGFGGVLADDMGLGKTVQALAHLLVEKHAGRLDRPCLVVAPRTVLLNWQRECERFAPGLRCAVFHGPERDAVLEGEPPDLVITTYALLHRDPQLQARDWHVVILDEAQAIKNPQTSAAVAARGLRARQRLCLTGTPMENNLDELWSLLSFSTPGLLGSRRHFGRHYRNPIERDGHARRFSALSTRVAPFLLRRTKAQVLTELPPKTEVLVTVPLHPEQRDLYESVRMTMEGKVRSALRERGLARSQIVVLDALLKLRQVCCHPSLVKTEAARRSGARSAKTERLMELLTELLAEGRRAIVFSQFTSMLELIAQRLEARGIEHRRITGQTRRRQPIVDAFQAGEFPVLLVSLKAGGTGINLTAADVVIHYDPWWNPAIQEQATDRAHRIGQTRPVTVYRLVCAGTVEQGVLALQERKRALTDGLQRAAEQRSEGGLRLKPEDVDRLLAPLEG